MIVFMQKLFLPNKNYNHDLFSFEKNKIHILLIKFLFYQLTCLASNTDIVNLQTKNASLVVTMLVELKQTMDICRQNINCILVNDDPSCLQSTHVQGCQLPDFSLRSQTFCYAASFLLLFYICLNQDFFCTPITKPPASTLEFKNFDSILRNISVASGGRTGKAP